MLVLLQKETNVEILIPRRPRLLIPQILETLSKTQKEWLLLIDDDAILFPETERKIFDPSFQFDSDYDIIAFTWVNTQGKKGYQTGLYRVKKLKEVMPLIKSPVGMDIILQALMKSTFSKEFSYIHPLKNNFSAYFRWGKGRAFCLRMVKSKKLYLTNYWHISHLKLYIAWIYGFLWGLIAPMKEETW